MGILCKWNKKENGGNYQQGFIHYKYVYTYHTDGGVRCGRVHIVVGFITTYAIGVYHHWCEFDSGSVRGVTHYVIKFVSVLGQVGCFLHQ